MGNVKRKTCARGHRMIKSNLYVYPSGKRECKECRKRHFAKRKRKREAPDRYVKVRD